MQITRRFMFLLPLVPAVAALAPTTARATGVKFHFYGALNCPPCMAFKRNYLAGVRADGQKHGFEVMENIIPRLQDMGSVGIYGPTDAVLREAGKQLPSYYPPIFFVTVGDEVTTVYQGDWQKALADAIDAASV